MAHDSAVELWTLYAFGVFFTMLRTYARVTAVSFRELRADDYLIWFAILIYTTQCILGYNIGILARGLANNGMTDEQRSALSQEDPEYGWRVTGSKIQVAGWTTAACLLWTLKMCVAIFLLRLTNGLKNYHKQIYAAMALIAATFVMVILTIYLSCRPFNHYWQIYPNPGNACQAGVSKPIVVSTFVTNVFTDACLLMIPIPMLWKSTLRRLQKIASTLVLSAGVFIIICATLKSIYVLVDPIDGGQLAAQWGTRETFVAVVTTNLPMIFPLLKNWLSPFIQSTIRSSSNNKAYKSPGSGFVTIGGGGASNKSKSRPDPHSEHDDSGNTTFYNESEENIVKGDDVQLQNMELASASQRTPNGIMVSKNITVISDYDDERNLEPFKRL
ncbi:hypothetical protein DM02DRAFT_728888 [Periconia macrospinosa]|uniref:Rhodopsin domain-containing protein n=1 Tax=Periconia macrospinosa TaxID=97972 RepID=A0A2V1DRW5_9PLEO|nr:hypothetical protein DM02DRAFT_728888 [Periconia macrospinosa]